MKNAAKWMTGYFNRIRTSKPLPRGSQTKLISRRPHSTFHAGRTGLTHDFTSHYSTSTSATTSHNLSNWLFASATLGGLAIGGFMIGARSDEKEERDLAKETYLV